tara:strand:+ start:479 stop:1153 length:675 start_codon:yes stop_codon:yes gene_type:complete
MATGQSILDLMEGLDRELKLQSGEVDVTLGLKLLNAAQDYFESVIALQPNLLGDDIGTVTTTADTESTAYPSAVLRIDRLQFIDSATSRPAWDLDRIGNVGGHFVSQAMPILASSNTTTGKPVRYWTDGSNIYWDPLPSDTHTVRYYGLTAAADITAAGTFAYPDMVMLPLASFAARLFQIGKGDVSQSVGDLATEAFDPVVQTLSKFNRDRVQSYDYRYSHSE